MKKEIKEEIEQADESTLDEILTEVYRKKRTHSVGGGELIFKNN